MIYINFRIHPIVYRRVIDLLRKSNYFENLLPRSRRLIRLARASAKFSLALLDLVQNLFRIGRAAKPTSQVLTA